MELQNEVLMLDSLGTRWLYLSSEKKPSRWISSIVVPHLNLHNVSKPVGKRKQEHIGLSPQETLSVGIVKFPRCGASFCTNENEENFSSCATPWFVTCLYWHLVPVIVFHVVVLQLARYCLHDENIMFNSVKCHIENVLDGCEQNEQNENGDDAQTNSHRML